MRKILILLLVVALLIPFAGCSNDTGGDLPPTTQGGDDSFYDVPDEFTYFSAPQYSNPTMDPNYLKENDYFSRPLEEHSHVRENFALLDGKVIDVYTTRATTYALTEDTVYCIDNLGLYVNKFDIDIGENVKIVASNARNRGEFKYLILQDREGNYSVYIADKNNIVKFYKCAIDNFAPSANEQIVLYDDANYNCINLVSFVKNKISVRSYTITNPEDASSVIYTQRSILLKHNTSGADIVAYMPDNFLGGNEGVYLLSNGEMHIVNELFGNGYDNIELPSNKIVRGVHSLISKDVHYIYYYATSTVERNLISYVHSDANVSEGGTFMSVAGSDESAKVVSVFTGSKGISFGLQNDGTFLYNQRTVHKASFVAHELLSTYRKEGKIVDMFLYNNVLVLLMDDHYFYSVVLEQPK